MSFRKFKTPLLIILLLAALCTPGCKPVQWNLVTEGYLTDIEDVGGRVALTFNSTEVALLHPGYGLETPTTIILGTYYYLYKEDAGWCWSGYHLLEEKR